MVRSSINPILTLDYMIKEDENKIFDRKSAQLKPSEPGGQTVKLVLRNNIIARTARPTETAEKNGEILEGKHLIRKIYIYEVIYVIIIV